LEGYYDGNDDCTSKIKTKKNVYNLLLNYIICKFLNLIFKECIFPCALCDENTCLKCTGTNRISAPSCECPEGYFDDKTSSEC
jgi:hypothetical protein